MHRPLLALLALGLLLPGTLAAHGFNTAQWQLSQLDAHSWEGVLRLPEDAEGRLLSLQPGWPEHCSLRGDARSQPADEASLVYWVLDCPEGLHGSLSLSGFDARLPDAVLRLVPLDAPEVHVVLSSHRPAWTVSSAPAKPPVAHYLRLGVEHILGGLDHLLFVFGLWLLWRRQNRGLASLVWLISAFTLGHALSLSSAMLAGWSLPLGVVEAMIAASVLLLAVELASPEPGAFARRPLLLALACGLLHGLGFAGALGEIGLPAQAQLWALAAFNLGVEFGQLLVVLGLLLLARPIIFQRTASQLAPLGLLVYGGIAAFWTLSRTAEFIA